MEILHGGFLYILVKYSDSKAIEQKTQNVHT